MAGIGDLLQAPFNPITGPQTGTAPTIDQTGFNQYMQQYGGQGGAMSLLQQAAMGRTPSVAQQQLQQGMNQAMQQAQAQAGSARGNMGLGMAQKNAQAAQANLASQASGQAAQLRAQEMAQARQQYATGALAGAQASLQPAEQQAQLQMSQNQLNEQAQAADMQAQAANQKQGSSLISGAGQALSSLAGLAVSDENAKSDMDPYAMSGGKLLSPSDAEGAYARGVYSTPGADAGGLAQTQGFMGDAQASGGAGGGPVGNWGGVFQSLGNIPNGGQQSGGGGGGGGGGGPIKDLYGGDSGAGKMFTSIMPHGGGGGGGGGGGSGAMSMLGGGGGDAGAAGDAADAGASMDAAAAVSDARAKEDEYKRGVSEGARGVLRDHDLMNRALTGRVPSAGVYIGPKVLLHPEPDAWGGYAPYERGSDDMQAGAPPGMQAMVPLGGQQRFVEDTGHRVAPVVSVKSTATGEGTPVVPADSVRAPQMGSGQGGESTPSDERLKDRKAPGEHAAAQFLETLQPHAFTWKDPSAAPNPKAAAGPNLGVYAQEVEQSPWGHAIVQRDPRSGYKTLDMRALMGALAAGVGYERKQQQDHESRIADLEAAVHGSR